MVWPVAFPLEAFLTRAGITALGTATASEGIKSLQNQNMMSPEMAKEAFMRTLMGPTTEILNRTTDTPSGKVFAPTGEVIESNQIPGMASAEQPQGLPGLLIPQQEKQVEGMSQASPPTKDKGFTMPTAEDMKILYKKAPVATKELNQLGEDQIKSFIEGQDNLYNDYEIKWNEGKLIKEGGVSKNKLLTKEDIVETYPGQYKPLHRYWEDIWEGGVGDTGQRIAGDIMRAAGTETTKEGFSAPSYYEDYRSRLEEHARKTLGKTFPGYRLMSRGEMKNLLEGGEATEEVKSYSLSKDKALWFQNFLGNADKKDDLVLAEVPLFSEGLVMRGKPQESEIVYDNQFTFPKEMNFYDLDGNLIKGAEEGMFGKAKEQPTETVPTQDLTVENIQNKIKYKKSKFNNNITEAYLGDKKVGELEKMTGVPKMNGMYDYQIYWTNEQGEIDPNSMDVQLGFNSAKDIMTTKLWNTIKSQEKPIEPKDIEKEITFKKSESADTYDVLYKGKLIKQLYKKGTKYEGQNEYVVIEPSDGSYDDTFIGLDNSKERVKQNIARQILEKNTSKSAGSLIDKPLSDE